MNKYSLKNRTHIPNAIDTELYEQLTQYFKDTDIPVSKLLDRSIRLLLESTKK
ncbi:ribbon-helix-helix domain-containing protein [Clostridium sp. UBA1056]|uniref:ribbon-helix-helix domain-containing protein n=1 Tax=unclassified Clostridium TaxID=2614128 RepID=UPI0032167FE5